MTISLPPLDAGESVAADRDAHGRVGFTFATLIFSAALVNPLAMTALLSVLPAISNHFSSVEHAPALVRGLVSVVAISLVFAAPFAGYMAERFGVRRVLLVAAATFIVSGMSGYFIDDLWLLLASRIALGIADAFIGTLVIALVALRLGPKDRDRWIGWYTFAAAAGAFAIIPLSGVIARTGWHNVFLLYALALPILLSAATVLNPSARELSQPESDTIAAPSAFSRAWLGIPFALVAVGLVSGAVENTTHIFLPFRLTELGETSPSRIAHAVLPIAIGGAASAFCYGHVRQKLSIASTFLVAFLWGGISLLWLGQAASYEMIIVAGISLGLAVGLLAPNANAFAAAQAGPAGPARSIGFARGAFFAGAPVAQLLLEPIASSGGASAAIIALGIFSLLIAVWPLTRLRMSGRTGVLASVASSTPGRTRSRHSELGGL